MSGSGPETVWECDCGHRLTWKTTLATVEVNFSFTCPTCGKPFVIRSLDGLDVDGLMGGEQG